MGIESKTCPCKTPCIRPFYHLSQTFLPFFLDLAERLVATTFVSLPNSNRVWTKGKEKSCLTVFLYPTGNSNNSRISGKTANFWICLVTLPILSFPSCKQEFYFWKKRRENMWNTYATHVCVQKKKKNPPEVGFCWRRWPAAVLGLPEGHQSLWTTAGWLPVSCWRWQGIIRGSRRRWSTAGRAWWRTKIILLQLDSINVGGILARLDSDGLRLSIRKGLWMSSFTD